MLGISFEDLLKGALSRPVSVASIIFANLSIILGVFFFSWSLGDLILLYWAESAVIGFFTILKMWFAKGHVAGKIGITAFFMIHYGMFMFGHLVFILGLILPIVSGLEPNDPMDLVPIVFAVLPGIVPLFLSHGVSFATNYLGRKEFEGKNPGNIMFAPYGRIIAMHIFIIASGFVFAILDFLDSQTFVTLYTVLVVIGKTLFDLGGHLGEHMGAES